MHSVSKKILGVVILCLSVPGFLLSIVLLYEVWHIRQPVINNIQTGLDQSSAILQNTEEGLSVIDEVVRNVYTSTIYLDDATGALADTMRSTSSFMDSAGNFVGEDLIHTITNTQTALNTAQASAGVIDNILTTLSRIPLIGISYNPAIPLNQALGDISTSLDPVQVSLKNFETSLGTTNLNLLNLKDQLTTLQQEISLINNNLLQAQATITSYKFQVDALITSVHQAKTSIPRLITPIVWAITGLIIWLLLIQIAILLQAVVLLSFSHHDQDKLVGSDPPKVI